MARGTLARGLSDVPTESLRHLLRRVHGGVIRTPLDVSELACVGLQAHTNDILDTLRGLDRDAIRAVVVTALAERAAADERAEAAKRPR